DPAERQARPLRELPREEATSERLVDLELVAVHPRQEAQGTDQQVCLWLARAFGSVPDAQVSATAKSWCLPSSPLSSTSRLSTKSISEPDTNSRTSLETSTSPPSA